MNKSGPIVIIDDDADDREILEEIFSHLHLRNDIRFFESADTALQYLQQPSVQPFLLLSDINMPGMDGFQLRSLILGDELLKHKCIPYIFFTTGATLQTVQLAYEQSVQGIFAKPPGYDKWTELIRNMVTYWQDCIAPNRWG